MAAKYILDLGGLDSLAVDLGHSIAAAEHHEYAITIAARKITGAVDAASGIDRIRLQSPGDQLTVDEFTQRVVTAANQQLTDFTARAHGSVRVHDHRLGVGHQRTRGQADWIVRVAVVGKPAHATGFGGPIGRSDVALRRYHSPQAEQVLSGQGFAVGLDDSQPGEGVGGFRQPREPAQR